MSLKRGPAGVLANERGGLIVGWIGKIVIAFIIVGVVIFDTGSILVNFFTLDSTADEIAIELSLQVRSGTPNQQELQQSAEESAAAAGARLLGVEIDAEKDVLITLRRRADTLVVERIGYIRNWALATAEGRAGST